MQLVFHPLLHFGQCFIYCCRQLHFGWRLIYCCCYCVSGGVLSTVAVNCVSAGILSTVKLIAFGAVIFAIAFHLGRLLNTQRALMYIYMHDIHIQMQPVYIVILIATIL